MKSWKYAEKRIAEWYSDLGPDASRKSTAQRGQAVEDIEWGKFSIEVKTRRTVPGYLHEWMEQAAANAVTKTPVVHWHQDHQHTENDFVVMRAQDFRYFMSVLMALLEKT